MSPKYTFQASQQLPDPQRAKRPKKSDKDFINEEFSQIARSSTFRQKPRYSGPRKILNASRPIKNLQQKSLEVSPRAQRVQQLPCQES